MKNTTIVALATPLATSSIGVVRLSGDGARQVAAAMFRPAGANPVGEKKSLLTAPGYTALYGRVVDGDEEIDEGVALVFAAPHSYTGEDVVEISCHGGVYILQQVVRVALGHGAVAAAPGEFTKRAFLNGKLSLTQAEGVMDLISARGRSASRMALAARDGVMSRGVEGLAGELVALAAHLGAWIDYPEEEIEELLPRQMGEKLRQVQAALQKLLGSYDTGRMLREGVVSAIIGRPNVGKSTLMNLLAGYERSIVTDIPGTTRDVVEDLVQLPGGLVLRLADTAGIRATDDTVEAVGVRLANRRMESSDLILAVFDGSAPLGSEEEEFIASLASLPVVVVVNKADLPLCDETLRTLEVGLAPPVLLSARDGTGLEALTAAIEAVLGTSRVDTAAPMLANERQRDCIRRGVAALSEALEALEMGVTLDAVSVCVDEALAALLELEGRAVSETVVDAVFANFCVGK